MHDGVVVVRLTQGINLKVLLLVEVLELLGGDILPQNLDVSVPVRPVREKKGIFLLLLFPQ